MYIITGADADAIRTSYKRLAQKWYPEKNPKSEEAVQVSDNELTSLGLVKSNAECDQSIVKPL